MKNIKNSTGAILILTILMLALLTGIVLVTSTVVTGNVVTANQIIENAKNSQNSRIKSYLAASKLSQQNFENSYIFFVDTLDPEAANYNITCSYTKSSYASLSYCDPKTPPNTADLTNVVAKELNLNNLNTLAATQANYSVSSIDPKTVTYTLNISNTDPAGQQTNYKSIDFTKSCPNIIPTSSISTYSRIQPNKLNNLKMIPLSSTEIQKLPDNINKNFPNLYCTCDWNGTSVPILNDGSCYVCKTGYYLKNNAGSYSCQLCPSFATRCENNQVICPNGMKATTSNNGNISCVCDTNKYINSTGNCTDCPDNAICYGTSNFNCKNNFDKFNNACICKGFITGTGINTTCNSCPKYATCNGTDSFSCYNNTFTKDPNSNTCQCSAGYVSGSGTSTRCNTCPAYAEPCDGTETFTCKPGFTKQGASCVCKGDLIGSGATASCCPQYSQSCTADPSSFSCKPNFTKLSFGCVCNNILSGVGTNAICCPPYTSSCTSATDFICRPGFTKQNDSCVCNDIQNGVGPNATCTKLPTGCSTVNGSICTSCANGYYLNGNNCSICPDYATCQGGTNSFACYNATFSKTSSKCNCTGYTSGTGTSTVCNRCPDYATCNGTNNFYCLPTFTKGNNNNCLCNGGYINNTSVPITCNICPKYATSCSANSFTCPSTFTKGTASCNCTGSVTGTGTSAVCNPCSITNCSSCNGGVCSRCAIGFYLNAGNCVTCPPYAQQCDGSDTFTCPATFNKGASTCNCPGNINGSGPTAVCSCNSGSYLNTDRTACALCSSAMPGCAACGDSTVCTTCNTPSYYKNSNNTCTACSSAMPGCTQCSSSTVCTACDTPGYYKNSSNTCSLCSTSLTGCTACSSSTVCTACDTPGYYKNSSNTCSLCSTSLTGCTACSSSTVCTACDTPGYYKNSSNTCSLCSTSLTGCTACSSSTVCRTCDNHYYLDTDNQCKPCPPACGGRGCSYYGVSLGVICMP